jgi:hypothetical protein
MAETMYYTLVAGSALICRINYFFQKNVIWHMLILENILQYSFIFSVNFIFLKKIIFLIFRHSIFGIILCRTCYLATVVRQWIAPPETWLNASQGVNPLMPPEPFCGLWMTTSLPGRQRKTIFHPLILEAAY